MSHNTRCISIWDSAHLCGQSLGKGQSVRGTWQVGSGASVAVQEVVNDFHQGAVGFCQLHRVSRSCIGEIVSLEGEQRRTNAVQLAGNNNKIDIWIIYENF